MVEEHYAMILFPNLLINILSYISRCMQFTAVVFTDPGNCYNSALGQKRMIYY
jgi:hypothetical protein